MTNFPPELLEQIAQANDVVDVVGSYISLRRQGRVFKALCPFHNEKSPSFHVTPDRQIFKCFGCQVGGSVFRFEMLYNQLSFGDAVRKLAKRANIIIPEAEQSVEQSERAQLRKRMLSLHLLAADFFHRQLTRMPEGGIARDYLKGRGFGLETAKRWQLGYAPDSWDALRDLALREGFSARELYASGLMNLRDAAFNPAEVSKIPPKLETRGLYDRFRGRMMIPICNDSGEVIAFSGRVLAHDPKEAKYVNSPETILFVKGNVLFGLHHSKRALIENRRAVVCEGQLDLIAAFESGVRNVIAAQGTAFTDRQASLLKRYVDEVALCFDADAAGVKATERSLPALFGHGLSVRVVEMPPGEDPDSLIRGSGPQAFVERVAAAPDYFDYQIARQLRNADFASPQGRSKAARMLARDIALVRDPVVREAWLQKASMRFDLGVAQFTELLPKLSSDVPSQSAPPGGAELGETFGSDEGEPLIEGPIKLDPMHRLLLHAVLRDERARAWVLEQEWSRVLAFEPEAELLTAALEAEIDLASASSMAAFLAVLSGPQQDALGGVLEDRLLPNLTAVAAETWHGIQTRQIRRRMDALTLRMRQQGLSTDEIVAIHKNLLDLQGKLKNLPRPSLAGDSASDSAR
jgi:DNA primase